MLILIVGFVQQMTGSRVRPATARFLLCDALQLGSAAAAAAAAMLNVYAKGKAPNCHPRSAMVLAQAIVNLM